MPRVICYPPRVPWKIYYRRPIYYFDVLLYSCAFLLFVPVVCTHVIFRVIEDERLNTFILFGSSKNYSKLFVYFEAKDLQIVTFKHTFCSLYLIG